MRGRTILRFSTSASGEEERSSLRVGERQRGRARRLRPPAGGCPRTSDTLSRAFRQVGEGRVSAVTHNAPLSDAGARRLRGATSSFDAFRMPKFLQKIKVALVASRSCMATSRTFTRHTIAVGTGQGTGWRPAAAGRVWLGPRPSQQALDDPKAETNGAGDQQRVHVLNPTMDLVANRCHPEPRVLRRDSAAPAPGSGAPGPRVRRPRQSASSNSLHCVVVFRRMVRNSTRTWK
jgi:hypothetical protein